MPQHDDRHPAPARHRRSRGRTTLLSVAAVASAATAAAFLWPAAGHAGTAADRPAGRPAAIPAAPAAPATKAERYAKKVVELANAERRRAGCAPLRADKRLMKAAQAHADDMARRNYYSHTSPEGRSAGDRMTKAGYRWSSWGENIYKSPRTPARAMAGWMDSPGHRANILNCRYKDIGVGVNLKGNGPWWVQNFGTRR
ncbi:CAP domain-containing protein [Streptomyces bambusae]|uniref:CAP domain-containing protein n=1 Tax=Streptomyces bambusae TaxID=1550616 RepID=UPI001CFD3FF0|nr:CAP domain-containing protein [Streptomyces bambusae]MCB5166629.1 CAP domain-containing protein [Streptomyces bambusae]